VVFVLGGPGAGKGTQCGKLVSEYGFVHLSAGDLLRAERDSGSPLGTMIEECIREGNIVPVEVTVQLIKKAMESSPVTKFLVDGFPRNFDNLQGWQRVMGEAAEVECVLFYDCPEEVMEARLLDRGKTSGRSDDNIETIKKRFKTFVDATMPVVEHYAKQGRVYRVMGVGPVDEVFAVTRRVVDPIVHREVLAHTQLLLDSVHALDWATYERLTAPDVTSIEGETNGEIVAGLPFHRHVFEARSAERQAALAAGAAVRPPSASTIATPVVRLLDPKTAVVAYNRVVQRGAGGRNEVFGETRVWKLRDAGWQQVHFHRSPAGAHGGK
jgi:UMP-CMP kinase